MQDKKVGIVIPIYNVEKYLDECLQSVIDQTYTNLSIVLVNDGSNDNSLSIAKKYALQDERIIIIDKKNGGLSSARNTGIDFF
ncbi:glycosyltransferase, partial [Campylobacter jejuni]|nr:glycosyltransferase [Campylobacter jejuni]